MPSKNNKNSKNTKENIEKKKSYFDINRKKRTKNLKNFVLPILGGIGILLVVSMFLFSPNTSKSSFGALGSAHEHAAFLVKINGKNIDFSLPKYQVQSDYIHVENGDGTTLHRHATNVTFADFLDSVKMSINQKNNNNCLLFDNGTQYCDDSQHKLNAFINGNLTTAISNYILNNNDRLLLIYGNETDDQMNKAVKEVNDIKIQFT
jgi:hypothetical protein